METQSDLAAALRGLKPGHRVTVTEAEMISLFGDVNSEAIFDATSLAFTLGCRVVPRIAAGIFVDFYRPIAT